MTRIYTPFWITDSFKSNNSKGDYVIFDNLRLGESRQSQITLRGDKKFVRLPGAAEVLFYQSERWPYTRDQLKILRNFNIASRKIKIQY